MSVKRGPRKAIVAPEASADASESEAIRAFEKAFAAAAADGPTGVSNRAYFFQLAGREMSRARRSARAASLLMLQVERLKDASREKGREAADAVLRAVAGACASGIRDADILGRIGPVRFAILLPETTLPEAAGVAERLRTAVSSLRVELPGGRPAAVTTSIGISTAEGGDCDLGRLLARAEAALNKAGSGGSGSVVACR